MNRLVNVLKNSHIIKSTNTRIKYVVGVNGTTKSFSTFKNSYINSSNNNNNNSNNNNNNNANQKVVNKPSTVGTSNNNSLQKAMLLVNIKDFFKKKPMVAIDLITKNLKQGNLNNQDIDILFQWNFNNKLLNNIHVVNLFLNQFVGVNDLPKIQKIIRQCTDEKIEMNLITYETLIKYFTISKMKDNLKLILDKFTKDRDENKIQVTKKTYQDYFITAYLELDDIENALYYYSQVEQLFDEPQSSSSSSSASVTTTTTSSTTSSSNQLSNWLEIIRYYISKSQFQKAIQFFKQDIQKYKTFLLSGTFSTLLNQFNDNDVEELIFYLYNNNLIDEHNIDSIISMHLENNLKTSSYLVRKWSNIIPMNHLYTKVIKQAIIHNDLNEIMVILNDIKNKRESNKFKNVDQEEIQQIDGVEEQKPQVQSESEELQYSHNDNNNKNIALINSKKFSLNIPTYTVIIEMAISHQKQLKQSLKENDELSMDTNLETIINHILELKTEGNEFSILIFYCQMKEKSELLNILIEVLNRQPIEYIDSVTSQIVKHFASANHYGLALSWMGNRIMNYNLPNNSFILYSFLKKEQDKTLLQFWKDHLVFYPAVTEKIVEDFNFKTDQMMILIESFLKEYEQRNKSNIISLNKQTKPSILFKQYDQQDNQNNQNNQNNNNNINQNNNQNNNLTVIKEQAQKELINKILNRNLTSINQLESLEMNKEVNLQLEKLLLKKIDDEKGYIREIPLIYEEYKPINTRTTHYNWLPKEFSNNFRYILSELDSQLKLSIDNNKVEDIYEIIKRSLSEFSIPDSKLLLTGYYKIYEQDKNKYIQLLQETPPFIRMLVFNSKFYYDLMKSYPDVALYLLQSEASQNYMPVLLNQILSLTLKNGSIDLFTAFGNLLMSTKTPIHLETLYDISKTLFEKNLAINNTSFLIKLIKYIKHTHFEDELTSMVNNGEDELDFQLLSNASDLTFTDFRNYEGYNHRLSFAYTILLNELVHYDLYEELVQSFQILGNYFNDISVSLLMRYTAKRFPIPPISNLNHWLSLIKHCKNQQQKNYFYTALFKELFNYQQHEISSKLVEKDLSITNNLTFSLFSSIISYVPNLSPKILINLFLRIYNYLPECYKITDPDNFTLGHYSSFRIKTIKPEIKSNVLYQIDKALQSIQNDKSLESIQLNEWKQIFESIPLSIDHSLNISDDSLNIITSTIAPAVLQNYQTKNKDFDVSTLSQLTPPSKNQQISDLKEFVDSLF